MKVAKGSKEKARIGARVRTARDVRALTQQELADKVGIAPQQLSRIENGHMRPRPQTIRRLAEALGVPVEQITGAEELFSRR